MTRVGGGMVVLDAEFWTRFNLLADAARVSAAPVADRMLMLERERKALRRELAAVTLHPGVHRYVQGIEAERDALHSEVEELKATWRSTSSGPRVGGGGGSSSSG